MALIKCGECGREVSDKAAACPGCGAPIANAPISIQPPVAMLPAPSANMKMAQPMKHPWLVLLGIMVVSLPLGILLIKWVADRPVRVSQNYASQSSERIRERRTVEYCDKRYKEMNADRQYTPDMLQFHSMTCRKLREDFKAKWGRDP